MRLSVVFAALLVASPAAAQTRCRLSAQECEIVDHEVAVERAAESDAQRKVNGFNPRDTIPLLADIKVKRMLNRVRRLQPAIAKEYLRIAACDVYGEIDQVRGSGEAAKNDCQ